jgi:hypothetical protein
LRCFGFIKEEIMSTDNPQADVRTMLQRFQDGYTKRDISKLDDFIDLFAAGLDKRLPVETHFKYTPVQAVLRPSA